jgi:hypothetical protein
MFTARVYGIEIQMNFDFVVHIPHYHAAAVGKDMVTQLLLIIYFMSQLIRLFDRNHYIAAPLTPKSSRSRKFLPYKHFKWRLRYCVLLYILKTEITFIIFHCTSFIRIS